MKHPEEIPEMGVKEPAQFRSVADIYQNWWNQVGKHVVNPVQREEMRRSFYAGAFSMFVMGYMASELPDEEAAGLVESWSAEFDAFTATLKHMNTPRNMAHPGNTATSQSTGPSKE